MRRPHPNWGHPDHDACGTGFVARLGGTPNHDMIEHALTALERLTHRGGVDADGSSGDGAGLLTAIPRRFLRREASLLGIDLPSSFAVGMLFLKLGQEASSQYEIAQLAADRGLTLLGWREVPIK